MKAPFVFLFVFTFLIPWTNGQIFTEINSGITPVILSAADWGDYDNDNDLDLIITGASSPVGIAGFVTKIYRNEGSDVFTSISTGIEGVHSGSVDWGDFDNDQDLDILITGYGTTAITKIYRNDGSDSFTDINGDFPGVTNSCAKWGDLNKDGYLDFVMIGGNVAVSQWYVSKIYYNKKDGTFEDINASFIVPGNTFGIGSIALGDYDKDLDLDILISASTYNGFKTLLYRNDGDKVFSKIDPGFIGLSQSSVEFGDYDQDTDLDVLIAGRGVSGLYAKIYRNDGADVFTDINATFIGVSECSVGWGDYDNDEDLDVLISGYIGGSNDERITKIYENNTEDSFAEDTNVSLEEVSMSSAIWGDYDTDGDLDIFLSGSNNSFANFAQIYRNDLIINNSNKPLPSGISIPNLVTLNNDGLNDRFIVNGMVGAIQLTICNQWGSIVFKSDNYLNEWPSKGLSSGLYFYHLNNAISNKEFHGWIQVVE